MSMPVRDLSCLNEPLLWVTMTAWTRQSGAVEPWEAVTRRHYPTDAGLARLYLARIEEPGTPWELCLLSDDGWVSPPVGRFPDLCSAERAIAEMEAA